jgi:hypothetical protein
LKKGAAWCWSEIWFRKKMNFNDWLTLQRKKINGSKSSGVSQTFSFGGSFKSSSSFFSSLPSSTVANSDDFFSSSTQEDGNEQAIDSTIPGDNDDDGVQPYSASSGSPPPPPPLVATVYNEKTKCAVKQLENTEFTAAFTSINHGSVNGCVHSQHVISESATSGGTNPSQGIQEETDGITKKVIPSEGVVVMVAIDGEDPASITLQTIQNWVAEPDKFQEQLLAYFNYYNEKLFVPSDAKIEEYLFELDVEKFSSDIFFAQIIFYTICGDNRQARKQQNSQSSYKSINNSGNDNGNVNESGNGALSVLSSMVICKNPRKKRSSSTSLHDLSLSISETTHGEFGDMDNSSSSFTLVPVGNGVHVNGANGYVTVRGRKRQKLTVAKPPKIPKIQKFGCRLLSPILMISQNDAAAILNMSPSKLSRKFSESVKASGVPIYDENGQLLKKGRKWPYRSLVRVDKEIRDILLSSGVSTPTTLSGIFSALIQNFREHKLVNNPWQQQMAPEQFEQLRKYIAYRMDVLFDSVIVNFSSAISIPPFISCDYIEVLNVSYAYGPPLVGGKKITDSFDTEENKISNNNNNNKHYELQNCNNNNNDTATTTTTTTTTTTLSSHTTSTVETGPNYATDVTFMD